MRDEKILISRDGPDSNVLKFKPPMVFTAQDADKVVDTLDRVLAELDGGRISMPNITLEVRSMNQAIRYKSILNSLWR